MKVAIIGGTGVYDPSMLKEVQTLTVETPYGQVELSAGAYLGRDVYFLPRHGSGHSVPPHKINYRANISALKELGVCCVVSTSAVGSLNKDMKPGDLVAVDQFIDFTKGRASTFYDGEDGKVVHTDFSEPYCPYLRKLLLEAAKNLGVSMHQKGCYVCTEGPRFETPAEIRMFQYMGGDIVGMTNVPEVVLAGEAGMCYATVAVVTNWAAGISSTRLTHQEVVDSMNDSLDSIRKILFQVIESVEEDRDCNCRRAPDAVEVQEHD
ncbi:MAG: S-methyl-5'-thioadenosine phosphorylase [Bacillota bacterium]|nr:S-methyl-5'-thioadenosine phosphorylase [Bacillota bacterium]HOB91682.1 S-methyl-5'-thioadenosine phosphorylase [Bacillota bacterium]HPZ54550.1 S-methyl-5'-thioadenosine phosphorylase [Bacillota bacterium]HQD18701.1 S-methyl-5'-thioadenosine phosphorylase [Bacillota bacterium]